MRPVAVTIVRIQDMSSVASSSRRRVPVHALGISQILAYGMLFYAFAPLKSYLAAAIGQSESVVLTMLSAALILQSALMPAVGGWCDRYGALAVMRIGFIAGGAGMGGLALVTVAPFANPIWFGICLVPVGVGMAMATYEAAFSAAVQLDEPRSRRSISIIPFYGGVASSLTWLTLHQLLNLVGLGGTCVVIAIVLGLASVMIGGAAKRTPRIEAAKRGKSAPFRWSMLQPPEKRAMVLLGASGALEYLLFSAATLLWINWFDAQFDNLPLAVLLASIYGPFQVVGRGLEMQFGKHLDARLTGLISALLVPAALVLVQIPSIPMAVLAMALFGMGHGVLTVSFGFVTNLYFRAEIYGRAKGIIATPRAFGAAIGPSVGGLFFGLGNDIFIAALFITSLSGTLVFASLLLLPPTNAVHIGREE